MDLEHKIKKILSRWDNGLCPGGQVLVQRGEERIYEHCFGYANLEHQVPVTTDTIFHIASISKQFTVLSVLLLAQDGLLSLEDDVRNYAGDLISFQEPVTLRQLCSNVSGIRDQWELLFLRGIKINDSINMEDINTTVRMQKSLNFPPQEGYLYSNTGFHLLSVIVERLSKMSFPEFVKQRIFTPLGMEHSLIRQSFSQIIPHLAYSYQDEGSGQYFYNPLNYSLYGPTAVNTCARDLMKVLNEYEHPSHFDPELLHTLFVPAVLKDGTSIEYCAGMMTDHFHGMTVYEHGGADAAYRGHMFWIPEEKLKIILLGNTNTYLASRAARKIAEAVLGLKPEGEDPEALIAGESASAGPLALDCGTEPALSEPAAGLYTTSLPHDPLTVEIFQKDGLYYMKREYCNTPLLSGKDGLFHVGCLDETICFHNGWIEYCPGSKSLRLDLAVPAAASSASLPCGSFYQEETDCTLEIRQKGEQLTISHLRYGTAPLYLTKGGQWIFSFNPDFTMYLTKCGDGLELNGYRVRKMNLK